VDIIQMGTEVLSKFLGDSVDTGKIAEALTGLLGDGKGGVDIAALASKMASSGELSSVIGSWLGDGANAGISADSITSMLGSSNVADFASKLGVDSSTAASGLSEALPQMMDKFSSGGSLLDSVGGAGGLLGAAKSFLS